MSFVGPTALHHADMAKFEFFDEKQLRWFIETLTPFFLNFQVQFHIQSSYTFASYFEI